MSSTLEHIYNQHARSVFNLALQYVQNTEDAQEIAQDVFVAVHEKIDEFRGDAAISTWIYRITVNKSLDFLKKKQRKKRWAKILPFGNTEEAPHFDHPGVLMEDKEAMENLFRMINALPEQQKTALILSKIEQLSLKEIAEIMGMGTKGVESLLFRAKENLKKKIAQAKDENKKSV